VDAPSKRKKLKAAKTLQKRGAYPPSAARCVGLLAIIETLTKKIATQPLLDFDFAFQNHQTEGFDKSNAANGGRTLCRFDD
jgi:hypothetical protein